jgi:RNA polymerase sigma-70 factor (ECF subfamily)
MGFLLWAVIDLSGSSGQSAEHRLEDEAAMDRIVRGDGGGLAELYDRHVRPVYSLALRILQDQADAEDVVQEVFSQAWRQAARYDATRGNVVAWLLTLARSRAIDRLRARRARPDQATGDVRAFDVVDQAATVDLRLLSAEQAARVRVALDELPLMQRMPIELAFYEGLTHTEIAERLEQPLGTVKTRIRLAMTKLRKSLAGMS